MGMLHIRSELLGFWTGLFSHKVPKSVICPRLQTRGWSGPVSELSSFQGTHQTSVHLRWHEDGNRFSCRNAVFCRYLEFRTTGKMCKPSDCACYRPVLEPFRFCVRFEVFTAVTMKIAVFWDVTPCGSCRNRRCGGTSILTRATRRNIPEDSIIL
jgi:hypothetical protein